MRKKMVFDDDQFVRRTMVIMKSCIKLLGSDNVLVVPCTYRSKVVRLVQCLGTVWCAIVN